MSNRDAPAPPQGASRVRWAFAGFLAIAAYLLVSEHRAHLAQALPWLVVLLCPILHVFMHRGHAGRGGAAADES